MKLHYFSFVLMVCILVGLFPAGCSEDNGQENTQVDLGELLRSEGTVRRDLTVSSVHMGRSMKYSVWLPPSFDEKGTYPFLYLLHGYGDDNDSWLDKGGAQGIAKDYYAKSKVPVVIVMPDGLTTFYQGNWDAYFHGELIPEVEKTFRCNGRRAVAGLSMGGYGTLYNVLAHPGSFVCGYAMSPATGSELEKEMAAHPDPTVFPPIWVESGKQDVVVSYASVEEFVRKMDDYGIGNEFIGRDGGHDWGFWSACLPKALAKTGEELTR